ncbi:MAG: hypothetical protein L3J29_00580 [Cyclobacteriaceae bacterium]|nr:hypothetical protein [Cyclobacteriaceae bacterium]
MFAQNKSAVYKKSSIQLGLFPGISTNGLDPGEYENMFSLNLFTGYGYSTRYFELNGLAGFNTASASGIHISGIANFIGGNEMVGFTEKEKRKQRRKGYETNLTGFQISGFLNYTGTNTEGAQITAGVNNTQKYLIGAQIGGLFNYVGSFTMGTQISLLGNYSKKSMSGVQISLLLNTTQGSSTGIQLGGYNHSGVINSTKGPNPSSNTGMQIGVVNTTGDMGGWQIGILNIGNRVAGTQIGIINIFKSAKPIDYKDGPAFGLLNIGGIMNPRAYMSELYLSNYGLFTGKPLNLRKRAALRGFYSYNEIIYSTNYKQEREIKWGASYRLGIISFTKSQDPNVWRNYFNFSAELGHYNLNKKFDDELRMRYAAHIELGSRLSKKMSSFYPFIGISYNYMPNAIETSPEFLATTAGNGKLWAGYSVGIMIH